MSTSKTPAITATLDGAVLTLAFSNGEAVSVDADTLSDDVRGYAMLHGLKQKLVDAAAIARNPDTGRSATIDDKFASVYEVAERLKAGAWNKTREGGEGTGGSSLLARALVQMTGKTRAAIEEFLNGKTKEERTALRKNPKVAAIIAELQAASRKDAVDTDSMLEALM